MKRLFMKDKVDNIKKQQLAGEDNIKKPTMPAKPQAEIPESGGRGGLDPSRFGDWEIAGKCVDF